MSRTTKRKADQTIWDGPDAPDFSAKTYVGVDNGVSGSIGIIMNGTSYFYKVPCRKALDYQKNAKNISRIDVVALRRILKDRHNPMAILERPMVNPQRFTASKSALRALEALLIVLEDLNIPYRFIDSKEWQKEILPKGIKGADALKKASLDIGTRLFPQFRDKFKGDADGILIAEHARRQRW